VKTLSGGETFLASLALALALAEGLAQLSAEGRASLALESLFLDEGFGTLDIETLDVVVSALDALHGGQRMVGIVTHVRELAERLPARLEVSRQGPTAVVTIA
jgi:exonuclease SbcC